MRAVCACAQKHNSQPHLPNDFSISFHVKKWRRIWIFCPDAILETQQNPCQFRLFQIRKKLGKQSTYSNLKSVYLVTKSMHLISKKHKKPQCFDGKYKCHSGNGIYKTIYSILMTSYQFMWRLIDGSNTEEKPPRVLTENIC